MRGTLRPTIERGQGQRLQGTAKPYMVPMGAAHEASGNLQARFVFMTTPCLSGVRKGAAISDPK